MNSNIVGKIYRILEKVGKLNFHSFMWRIADSKNLPFVEIIAIEKKNDTYLCIITLIQRRCL